MGFVALLTAATAVSSSAVHASASAAGTAPTKHLLCAHGLVLTPLTPVRGFDPLTASRAQLHAEGFPSRPAGGKLLATWRAYAKAYMAGRVNASCPRNAKVAAHPHVEGGLRQSPAVVHPDSGNWAGTAVHGAGFTDSETTFVVPTVSGGATKETSAWVGVNSTGDARTVCGSSCHPLVQAGADSFGNGTSDAWTEVYNLSPTHTVWNGVAGDTMFVHVTLNFTSGAVNFHMVDETQGLDYQPATRVYAGALPDGHAEAIEELLDGYSLASFGSQIFFTTEAYSTTTNWQYYNNLSNYKFRMVDGATILACSGPVITGGDFVVYRGNNANC